MALSDIEPEPALTSAPDQDKRLELRDLERALAKLPDEQRSALLLVGMEGMNYDQAAAVLDVPVGTIRSRLSRGREALRQLMGRGIEQEETMAPPAPPSCLMMATSPLYRCLFLDKDSQVVRIEELGECDGRRGADPSFRGDLPPIRMRGDRRRDNAGSAEDRRQHHPRPGQAAQRLARSRPGFRLRRPRVP